MISPNGRHEYLAHISYCMLSRHNYCNFGFHITLSFVQLLMPERLRCTGLNILWANTQRDLTMLYMSFRSVITTLDTTKIVLETNHSPAPNPTRECEGGPWALG